MEIRSSQVIFHLSLVICHFSFAKSVSAFSAVVRKNVAPASSRHTVLLTQKELSRLTCRRDAGATILSHDLPLRGGLVRLRSGCVEGLGFPLLAGFLDIVSVLSTSFLTSKCLPSLQRLSRS